MKKNITSKERAEKNSETSRRNNELFSLTAGFIFCVTALWFFISNIVVNIFVTAILLVLYLVLIVDVVDFNRALRNVNREVRKYNDHKKE